MTVAVGAGEGGQLVTCCSKGSAASFPKKLLRQLETRPFVVEIAACVHPRVDNIGNIGPSSLRALSRN